MPLETRPSQGVTIEKLRIIIERLEEFENKIKILNSIEEKVNNFEKKIDLFLSKKEKKTQKTTEGT